MLRFPIIRVSQPLGDFYITAIPAETLLALCYSDPFTLVEQLEDGRQRFQGSQRNLLEDRLKSIGRYIDTVESAFPNSIILAANYRESGELEERDDYRWSVTFEGQSNTGTLHIPSLEKLAAVVDGQHRLYGFQYAAVKQRREMALLCAVYLDLPNPFQAYLFATINYNQRPVDKSQSLQLFAFDIDNEPPDAWAPEKLAVYLSRRLNTDSESSLKGHIAVAAQVDELLEEVADGRDSGWLVSTATIVEGCASLFSSNAKRDRDTMHAKPLNNGRSRGLLHVDQTPLRDMYISCNDRLIYKTVLNYFNAVSEILWATGDPGFIRKTVGIQALFNVLKKLCYNCLEVKDVSEEYFTRELEKASDIDFHDNFFHASGAGKTRIRNVLECRIGLMQEAELPPKDREEYLRLLNVSRK